MGDHRIAELDGLRGLAVIAVMLMHTYPAVLDSGFVGVIVFFVLSGYLITSILLREHSLTGRVSLRRFYWRRVLRLAPALLAAVAFCVFYAVATQGAGALDGPFHHAASVVAYCSNWFLVYATSHGMNYDQHLLHTWSLAVEEQFYMAWPVLLLVLLRRRPSLDVALAVLSTAVVASWVWRVYALPDVPFKSYFRTETWIDSLMIGAFVAFLMHHRAAEVAKWKWPLQAVALVGLGTLGWLCWQFNMLFFPWVYQTGFVLISIITACIIMAAVSKPSFVLRWTLGLRPLAWVGLISYGLYVWHHPIFSIVNEHVSGTPLFKGAFGFGITFAVASASYYWLETPIKKRFAASVPRRQLQTNGALEPASA